MYRGTSEIRYVYFQNIHNQTVAKISKGRAKNVKIVCQKTFTIRITYDYLTHSSKCYWIIYQFVLSQMDRGRCVLFIMYNKCCSHFMLDKIISFSRRRLCLFWSFTPNFLSCWLFVLPKWGNCYIFITELYITKVL